MSDDRTLTLRHYSSTDRRLGRHKNHDSRSLRFLAPRKDPRTLTSRRHQVNVPIMDQGNVGSCTGHATTAIMGSSHFWPAVKDVLPLDPMLASSWAVKVYSDATLIDPWPGAYLPDDTGSDGLSVAKVMQARGLISGFTHATSRDAALTALAERVVMIGIGWRSQMFEPDSDGRIRIGGVVEGGHEIAMDEIVVEGERAWVRQSWGPYWGQGGRGWLTWDDLGTLLADDGDCTVLTPLSLPPPQPAPVPAAPTEDLMLAHALQKFLKTKVPPAYVRNEAENWLKGKV
jgi:hypothetical protein